MMIISSVAYIGLDQAEKEVDKAIMILDQGKLNEMVIK